MWAEGSEVRKNFECSIVLYGNNKQKYGIQSYHASYDPLSYPLFFPRGEVGWHTGIPKYGISVDTVNAAHAARGNTQENHGKNY